MPCSGPCNQGRASCPCRQACQIGDCEVDRRMRAVFWRWYAVAFVAGVVGALIFGA